MAKSTFLELVQDVHKEFSLSGDPPASVLNQIGLFADLVRWTADAAYEIEASRGNWNFMWSDDWTSSVTVGSAVITAPTDLGAWDRETFVLDASTYDYVDLVELCR